MNKKFLLLTIFADMFKYKTISSKNTFVNFVTSILMIIDKYLIIFIHLLTITRIKLYMILSRLLDDKSMTKFIKISFQDTSDINKKLNFL